MNTHILSSITSNYPFFLKTKERYYKAYSHKIDDIILDELTDLNKTYQLSYKRFTHKLQYDNVYVIGDIHGDYNTLLNILLSQKFIIIYNDYYNWNPDLKNTCIIQIGDFMHGYGKCAVPQTFQFFKPQELLIVRLFKHLIQTEINGNKLIVLLGNHEFMNITKKYNTGKILYANELYELLNKDTEEQEINEFILENCEICCCINNFLFTHAGITKQMIKKIYGFLKFPKECYLKLNSIDKIRLMNVACLAYINKIYKIMNSRPLNKEYIKVVCYRVFYSKIRLNPNLSIGELIKQSDNDADIYYLINNNIELLMNILTNCKENAIYYFYEKQLKTYEKIDAMFRNEINEIFSYNNIFSNIPKDVMKYIKLMFSNTTSKASGLLSNYFFSLSEDNYTMSELYFDNAMSEIPDMNGIIIGHSPQKNIILSFKDIGLSKKVLINVDNLMSIGQNQKDVIRQVNYDDTIIYKQAEILYLCQNTIKCIHITIDEYEQLSTKLNSFKPIILNRISL